MRSLMTVVSKVLFYAIAAGLLVWTASLTMAFVSVALPHLEIARYFALVVFDVGCVAWLLIFLFAADGLPQRATALILAIFDLAGVGLMVFAEIFTGGQAIANIPANIGVLALWGIGIWTVVNLIGVFAYHFSDPDTMQDIARRNAADKITAKSLKMLDSKMEDIADDVANELADRMKAETLVKLSANTKPGEVPALPKPGRNGHEEERVFLAETELPADERNPTRRRKSKD